MNAKSSSPIFLVGFPRSGTTLLRSIISAHSSIHLANNDSLLIAFMNSGLSPYSMIGKEEFKLILSQAAHIADLDSFLDTIPAATINDIHSTLPVPGWTIFEQLIQNNNSDKPIWGSKTHDYIWLYNLLNRKYSDCLFIVIVRDPRSVVLSKYIKQLASSSLKRANTAKFSSNEVIYEEARSYFIKASHQWQVWHNKLGKLQKNIGNNKILTLRYEDLLAHPEDIISSVFTEIKVAYEKEVLQVEKRSNDHVLSNNKTAFAHKNLSKPLTIENTRKWLDLDRRLISIVEHICAKSMKHYQYEATQRKSLWEGLMLNTYLDLRYKVRSNETKSLDSYTKYSTRPSKTILK